MLLSAYIDAMRGACRAQVSKLAVSPADSKTGGVTFGTRPGMEKQSTIIGDQLRALREQQHFSQGDIEKRTGLLRCYVSRVENGHTVPSIETLEKWARALNVPLY
jgi:DNA-binding XRE family transcriptional regulator